MPERATESDLTKAIIEVQKPSGETIDTIPVLFNPSEYSLKKSVKYGKRQLPGFSTPVTQFVSGDAETLSMELFFDTYEDQSDVRDYTTKLDDLLTVDGDMHSPPICKFAWGTFTFRCVLERAEKRFTMFLSDGTPVRARVNVTFREYKTPSEQKREEPRSSPDRPKIWRVTEGDTLWQIAASEYGDPEHWRHIATANDVAQPRELDPGTELLLPPLEP